MSSFDRNNLDKARSPYLRQHKDNPVHWQEWSDELLAYARKEEKPLLVSVGYATCHWCHVMAREAFSDHEIAEYLNDHFIAIKVDREERPDIDQYLMDFLVATTGGGGWPMNAFLSPEGAPFFAMTYAPVEPRFNMPGFLDILQRVLAFYKEKKSELRPYEPESYSSARERTLISGGFDDAIDQIRSGLFRRYDSEWAGFGEHQKFPPHSQLLYLLHDGVLSENSESLRLAEHTLDTIYYRGLHDHLGGGFFRYCVDREWTIPHFEKMLYDQALLLQSFSQGYRVLGKEQYRRAIEGIYNALESTFEVGGVYASGLDADTNHEEGATYTWEISELRELLGPEELERFESYFESAKSGNFEGKLHLVAMSDPGADPTMRTVIEKLHSRRKQRPQPERDDKVITSWNALAGIGLIEAWRATREKRYLERAEALMRTLAEKNSIDGELRHSSAAGRGVQEELFLEDRAAILLLISYLYEEGRADAAELAEGTERLLQFRTDSGWQSNRETDFITLPSQLFDSPTPAPASLAEMALLRCRMLLDEEYEELPLAHAFQSDYYNVAARYSYGDLYLIKAEQPLPWSKTPFPTLQGRSERENYCFRGVCYMGLPDT